DDDLGMCQWRGASAADRCDGMGLLTITYPAIERVAFKIGPLEVKWYGLAYVAGLLLGRRYLKWLLQVARLRLARLSVKWLVKGARLWPAGKPPFAPDKVDDLLLFMTVGVLLGGRL